VALQKHGIIAVVEGLPAFQKAMDSVNKKIADATKTTEQGADKVAPFNEALGETGKAADTLRGKLNQFIKDSVPFGNQLGGIVDQLVAIPLPALAAAAGVVALVAAFISLGNRGAPLQEIGMAFDNLTASVGLTSQALLKDLRAASEGTIADFDLIKTASTALLGVTGDFGKQFGKSLPEFLKIAKVEADATGRSVNELFNNLVEGVKKGTPKLIENTGLVIDQKAAYQDYAKTLGITAGQLSDTDKSMALLNATLTAGAAAIDTLSGAAESNADKLDRQQTTITNTFDSLAIAVQPAFGVVLDATQKVLDIFQQLALAVGPIFGGIVSIIAGVFSTIVDVITAIVQPIVNVISSIAPYFALAFQTIANIISGVGQVIGAVVGKIVTFLKDVAKNFFGLDLDNLGPQLFNGAAAAFGSFANGIISVANKLIFPAIIGIAQFIADFLIGFSPPKEGPLSVIDKGGENIMMAWLDGISGVSLDPVKKVAQQVSAALGNIGKQNIVQVTNRLAQLDKSLLPFQNRLDIIKSQFDALNAPAKAALDAIDRQTAALQDAVAQGDPQAVEKLRLLDAQREAIQKQVDAEQALVDSAQIQLGLKQAQQAPERALLNIRKAYLDALAKAQPKTSAGGGAPAAPKVPKEKAGAGDVITPAGGGGVPTASGADLPSVLDLIGGQDKVDAAAKGIQDAFSGQIDTANLDAFGANLGSLNEQIGRIGSVDIGAKITDKFKGLADAFNPEVAGSVANTVFQFFNGDSSNPKSLSGIIAQVGNSIAPAIDTLKTTVTTLLSSIFDPTIEGSPAYIITTLTAGADVQGSAAYLFAQLPQNVSDAASGLLDTLKQDVFNPVSDFLTGSGPGTLGGIISDAAALFEMLGPGIVLALQNFGGMVYNAVVVPIINVMNTAIGALETAINGIAKTFAGFLGNIIGTFDNAKIGDTNLGGLVPQALRDFQGGLANSNFTIGRISTALPSFLQAPAGAKGGLFGDGLFKVGEKGPEYLFSGEKFGVLPNQLTQVLDNLSSIMAQPSPMSVPAGNSNTTNNSSFTFNGVSGDNDARRRYNYLRAGMR
jgi:hypothetical protein